MKKIFLVCIGLIALIIISQLELTAAPSFKVEVSGKGKKALILIPGLSCPGEVWKETVAQYKDEYQCHVISLPGFAGQAPVQRENYLASMRDEIIAYIKENKLKQPILLGHSLGGFLSIWIAAKEPDLIHTVIAVDALPFFPAIQQATATPESMKPVAENMRKMMAQATPEQTKQSQQYFLPSMATATDKLELISVWGIKSDAPTVAQAWYEMQTTDLREEIKSVKARVLVLGAWIAYKNYGVTHESTFKNFSDQYASVPNKEVRICDTAKHFIMYDDADWFFTQTDSVLR